MVFWISSWEGQRMLGGGVRDHSAGERGQQGKGVGREMRANATDEGGERDAGMGRMG